jgi:hypothetical protein
MYDRLACKVGAHLYAFGVHLLETAVFLATCRNIDANTHHATLHGRFTIG